VEEVIDLEAGSDSARAPHWEPTFAPTSSRAWESATNQFVHDPWTLTGFFPAEDLAAVRQPESGKSAAAAAM